MKKKKAFSAILLAALLACTGMIASCGGGTDDSRTSASDDRNYGGTSEVSDGEEHLLDPAKTLHKKTVKEVGRTFVENGKTDYTILVGTNSDSAYQAADLLSKQIGQCTGAYPDIFIDADQNSEIDDTDIENREIQWNNDSRYLILSHETLEKKAGIQWDADAELGYSGYMIKTSGNSAFMRVNSDYGYQRVVQAFCREVLGYEWYSEDTITYTKDGSTLPDMDIAERPDFDFVDRSGYISSSGTLASGMTNNVVFAYAKDLNGGNAFVHNSFIYLPPTTYNNSSDPQNYHPKWYAVKKGQESNSAPEQLCYSSHGDQGEYDKMLNTAFESVMYWLGQNPSASTVTFTHEDKYGMCECDTCSAIVSEYGSITASFMLFVNDLDDLIQARLEKEAEEQGTEKREITVLFFAYSTAIEPPVSGTDKSNYVIPKTAVSTDEDGNKKIVVEQSGTEYLLPYHKTYENGLKCNEHVGVFFAPIGSVFTESFYNDANKEQAIMLEKWGLLTERVYAWIYDTNFSHFIIPYNSFDSIGETLRFLKDNNCMYIFNQAQGMTNAGINSVTTGFGALKTYLNMVLPFDVNQNTGELTDKFFENYFREAAEPMREYYESLVAYMQQLEELYPSVFYDGGLYTDTEQATYWPLVRLENWLELCDEAYVSVEKYKTSDPELYETLRKHIKIETLFPRFMICEYYAGYYTNIEIQQMRQDFYDDCQELNYQLHDENVTLAGWFEKWNVS